MDENFENHMKSDENFCSSDSNPICTEMCNAGNVSIISALRVTGMVDITHNFCNVYRYQIDINIVLTTPIAFAYMYFDNSSCSEIWCVQKW